MTPDIDAHDVAVVIPTRDRWDVLARTLAGLRAQTVSGFDVVVVVDGTDQDVPDLGPDVHLLVKDHAGPGAARNAGALATDRRLILLLGDDMLPEPDLVERHVEAHRRRPTPEEAVLGHVEWHPESRRGRLQRWLDWSGTQFDFDGIDGFDAGAGRFYSSNVSVKRDFLLDVGGFDEDFPFVYEDIDLGVRLSGKGMRLVYEPRAVTWHLHRYAPASMHGRFRTVGCGEHVMARKHPEFTPYFLQQLSARRRVAPLSPWPWLVDRVPRSARRLRHSAEQRAHAWYLKHLTADFLTGWTAGAELVELRRYLEGAFDYPALVGRGRPGAETGVGEHAELYESTRRVMEGAYQHHVEEIVALVGERASVLHYGCGTGTLGLHLLAAGADVTFVGRPGAAHDYLAWRLADRGHDGRPQATPRLDGEPGGAPGLPDRVDLALCPDLEDLDDPPAALAALERWASVVAAGFARPLPAGTAFDAGALLARARAGRLLRRRRTPTGGELVIYVPGPAGAAARLRSALVARAGHRLPGVRCWPPVPRS